MNTKWVGIVLLGVMVSTLSLAARTGDPSYLSNVDGKWIVGVNGYAQWNLGTHGSTWQDWVFASTPAGTVYPVEYYNLYNAENITANGPLAKVDELIDGDNNYLGLGFNIQIPNVLSAEKTIWFEVVYQGSVRYDWENNGVGLYIDRDDMGKPSSEGVNRFYMNPIDEDQADGLKVMTIGWTITPESSMEWFTFNLLWDEATIQSISIDTFAQVVPAPGAVVLAGFGAVIAGYFRRKY